MTDWRVLRPMRWATAGTVLAAREAMRTGGLAVNLSGGYHHASRDRGEGFCVYSDIGIAITMLRDAGVLAPDDRVVYVDLDAHQGNGVARVFVDDPRVFIFDVYNELIYPRDAHARRRIDCDLPVPPGCDDGRYLSLLRAELPPFLDARRAPAGPRWPSTTPGRVRRRPARPPPRLRRRPAVPSTNASTTAHASAGVGSVSGLPAS